MSKDAYYFSHDSNARNDQRLMKVRMQYGMEGYGIYFGIIEILRETENYTLNLKDMPSVAFDLRIELSVLEEIISNYDLFKIDGDLFYSRSLKRRLECLDKKKQIRAEAGRKGGRATQAKAKQKSSDAKAVNKIRLDKIRLDKSKVNNIKKDNISIRDAKFKKQVFEFANQYNKDLLTDFYSFWSEPNKSNTKMNYELKQTFDIGRRLATWKRNDFGNKKNGVKKQHNFKMPDG